VPRSRRLSWRISLLAGRHGVSCASPEAASRGVALRLLVRGPSAWGFEGAVDMSPYEAQWLAWRCPVAACSTASGMVVQWTGWSHRSDGDGGDRSHWLDVTALSRAGAE
jgi:hypothetical protein